MTLVFGKLDRFLCTGVRIYDIPGSPVIICGVQRHAEENAAFLEILKRRKTPIFLFNEMDVCLSWADVEIAEADVNSIQKFISPESSLYAGDFSGEASHALDCFCYSIDSTQTFDRAHQIETIEVKPSIGKWIAGRLSFIGERESHSILIDSKNEGEVLEKAIWSSLESVFPNGLHMSPQVRTGQKLRELTDVMTVYEYGTFLIEAKDLSVLQAGYTRSQERRTSGVQKQTEKAIGQLVGASKGLRRGADVFGKDGARIDVLRTEPFHCIVLLTELMHDGDWSHIERQLIEAMQETRDFFHVFDLSELIMLLKCSSGKAHLLDFNLIQRCKRFADTKSIHIRSRPAPNHSIDRTQPG
ncbi:hypothetical protein [Paracidovorax avenae]|uniref:hypothetical protein n=1 Tax=Paracidovorax avenae TaxID=80867 RepID=UPI00126031F7|nr:hypothetical protein [Paracidovorax avenae]